MDPELFCATQMLHFSALFTAALKTALEGFSRVQNAQA